MTTSSASSRRPALLLLAALLLAGGTFALWWFQFRIPKADPVAATTANARGVGLMEQFKYPEAAAEFEKAAKFAPDWLPARINLGMALYNSAGATDDPVLAQATAIFEQVLRDDADNPYAHFNLGVILKYQGKFQTAAEHFLRVTQIDPTDDRAWLYLGQAESGDRKLLLSEQTKKRFEQALELNPYLVPARNAIANHVLTTEAEQGRLHELDKQLRLANWEDEARPDRHSEQGRYATVIGRGPTKPNGLGPMRAFDQKSTWAVTGDVKWDDGTSAEPLITALRARYGGVIVRLDYNGDAKPDLLLLSAVIRDGKLSDLLLRNDGDKFTDVSVAAGLTGPGSLACAVGDYDNDGRPDLALSTATGLRLLRNVDGQKFEDKTATVGFDKIPGVFFALNWLDIDQDGDLDLIAGRYADTAEQAVAQITMGNGGGADGRVVLLQNVGVAPPTRVDEPAIPLTSAFKPLEVAPLTEPCGRITGLIPLDIDGDKDVDLIVFREGKPPLVILNDRLMRFHVSATSLTDRTDLIAGVILDANGDDQSDLLLNSANKPHFLVSKKELPDANLTTRFTAGATDSPTLLFAQRCDLDLDGRADLVGLSKDGKPVFLQGDGAGKLTNVTQPFGPAAEQAGPLRAVAVVDLDGDGHPDFVGWSAGGLVVLRGQDNGNHGLKLRFTGKRDNSNAGSAQKNLRTNVDGLGTKVVTVTGPLISMAELTAMSSGPGQSWLPVEIGIGKATKADALRIRWPDCVVQAELDITAGSVFTVSELNRKPTSCPVLMTWDGVKWVYVTDFLGGGALGECGADGSVRPSRPEESVKIEPHQLGLKDGKYVLRIAEPMDEVMYLDHVRLVVVDHPAGTAVHPDERFATADPQPTQKLLAFRDMLHPVRATDHAGVDHTKTVLDRDGKTVGGFRLRSWLGYAEDHWLELDFGDKLKGWPVDRPAYLVLAGWTDYPYPESIIAAAQAGVEMAPPVLERQEADGTWEKLGDIGFPAGLPKVMTVPFGDWLTGGSKFRIRTNLQVYWDEVYVGGADEAKAIHELKPAKVVLSHPGFVQEITNGGKPPQAYDPDRFEPVATTKWKGRLTKLGDVTELMAGVDDRFVLCGPGDEVTVQFDAGQLPKLPDGWVRSFVLRTHGYCKDTSPTTLTGGEVGPLPFRGMSTYPPMEAPPNAHTEDLRNWHTRPAGR